MWEVETGALAASSPVLNSQAACVAVAPDGKTLAVGDWEGKVLLWSFTEAEGRPALKQLHSLSGHTDNVAAVAFSPDGRVLASAGWDQSVRLWDAAAGKEVKVLAGHDDEVSCLAFSPDGRRLASGSRDHSVLIWEVPAK